MTTPADRDHETRARVELAAWRAAMLAEPSAFARAAKGLQKQVTRLIPEKVHQAVTAVIEQMTRGILAGSGFVTGVPLAKGSLRERELRVRKAIDGYRNVATAEGGVAGAGGFLLAAADFPALIAIKIKLLFEIARLYGHDDADWRERLFILEIFQLAFSSAEHRKAVYLPWPRGGRRHRRRTSTGGASSRNTATTSTWRSWPSCCRWSGRPWGRSSTTAWWSSWARRR